MPSVLSISADVGSEVSKAMVSFAIYRYDTIALILSYI